MKTLTASPGRSSGTFGLAGASIAFNRSLMINLTLSSDYCKIKPPLAADWDYNMHILIWEGFENTASFFLIL
jgi:hypothetical protein